MNNAIRLFLFLCALIVSGMVSAATVVPNEVRMPGTQPNEVGNLESPDKCDNCHAGYNSQHPEYEPATGWRGGAMGNASRDPVFWATLGVAEQDFDGVGDLCIRCHSTGGWYGGHSTPTDGSGLASSDDNGVDCDTCHTMTNTDNSELLGVMNPPFIANCSDDPLAPLGTCLSASEGYYGSGMLSLWSGAEKLGPYSDAAARHKFIQSKFHRDVDFCGSCHDVSNPVVGDLAPDHGAQPTAAVPVSSGGALGGPVTDKAAFNNPPYAYGVVERTFSEYKASAFPTTQVSAFASLPSDLQVTGGAIESTYQSALLAGTGGNYEDGTTRYFSCQSCHMHPVQSAGCNKAGAPLRNDLPMHDQTGGNYWFTNMTQYQDSKGTLRLGGGLNVTQITDMNLGQQRAVQHLQQAASLQVSGNTLRIVNLTGHKLITGYPEGRRMWVNIKWYDSSNQLLREDGAYGPIGVSIPNPAGGPDVEVESILDLSGTNTRIYEAHYGMTKEWADKLLAAGIPASLPLSFDRTTGAVDFTLGDLAASPAGSVHETFHFALNNTVVSDNRIPPYGMRYDEAQRRNALPVPASQYGNPGPGGTYQYWDTLALNPPANADHASIQLLYQGTSWEYMQFLYRANTGQDAFLGQEGTNMLDAWVNAEVPVAMSVGGDRRMVPPVVMATATWGNATTNNPPVAVDDTYSTTQDSALNVSAPGVLGNDSDPDGDSITAVKQSDPANGSVTLNADGSFSYTPNSSFSGSDSFTYQALDSKGAASATATVTITVEATGTGTSAAVSTLQSGVLSGKGKSQTFTAQTTFTQGDSVVLRSTVVDGSGNPVAGATVTIAISGPENTTVTSASSDASGIADATWKTSAPRHNGGGTATGNYTATVTGVAATAATWDGVQTSTSFTLNP